MTLEFKRAVYEHYYWRDTRMFEAVFRDGHVVGFINYTKRGSKKWKRYWIEHPKARQERLNQ